jgi:hypothetical protein
MSENSKDKNNLDQGTSNERSPENDNRELSNNTSNRGGTVDMDNEALTGGRRSTGGGSGTVTKKNVTGSDFDGQVTE